MRPMSEDGYPIVSFHDRIKGLYLTVMHSAITLAPLIARLAASEIINRKSRSELVPCRLSRFKEHTRNDPAGSRAQGCESRGIACTCKAPSILRTQKGVHRHMRDDVLLVITYWIPDLSCGRDHMLIAARSCRPSSNLPALPSSRASPCRL